MINVVMWSQRTMFYKLCRKRQCNIVCRSRPSDTYDAHVRRPCRTGRIRSWKSASR
jgi:hypothetical protein